VRKIALKRIFGIGCFVLLGLAATGCQKEASGSTAAGMQAMPVQTVAVTLAPVAQSSEYVATIKSRRSATLMPQVSGMLTQILVRSGDHVKAGQLLMEIDPRLQMATVESARATERQKKAIYDYNAVEIERQRKLFEAGVTSRDAYDQAQQSLRQHQGGLRVGGGAAQDAGRATGLLHHPRAFRRRGGRHSGACGRLCSPPEHLPTC
jgi:multidrug efflux pump subunit AcrA (membrane-fusion protein)